MSYIIKNQKGDYYESSGHNWGWTNRREAAARFVWRSEAYAVVERLEADCGHDDLRVVRIRKKPRQRGWVIKFDNESYGSRCRDGKAILDVKDKRTVFETYREAVVAYAESGFLESRIVGLK